VAARVAVPLADVGRRVWPCVRDDVALPALTLARRLLCNCPLRRTAATQQFVGYCAHATKGADATSTNSASQGRDHAAGGWRITVSTGAATGWPRQPSGSPRAQHARCSDQGRSNDVHGCACPFIGHLLDTNPVKTAKYLMLLALPRGPGEFNKINDLRQGLGKSCPIAFQSVSAACPKPKRPFRTFAQPIPPASAGAP
jgi:hypothetical protein